MIISTMLRKNQIITNVRRFNRFYTKQIGLLNDYLLNSPFSLTEARIMYEIANNKNLTASVLSVDLKIDPGLLSRIIKDFEKQNLIKKERSRADARQSNLYLTEKGYAEFEKLDLLAREQIKNLLANLSLESQKSLVKSMREIEFILNVEKGVDKSYIIRNPQAGDFGWVIQKNGEVYAAEYAWDEEYEGLVAEIVAGFIKNFNPKRERCWIAEMGGENIGSVFLVEKDKLTAQLRLLIVDPKARGLGIGRRLVEECTKFARKTGYKKITLWTNSILKGARHIYAEEGYKLIKSEDHHSFGQDLKGETWELEL